MRWWWLFLPVVGLAAEPDFHIQRQPVPGGAEILTVFGPLTNAPASAARQAPLVSILRDTLGDDDPSNDRLRYVWVLTSAHPNLRQRIAAAIPFFYFHPNLGRSGGKPSPVLDLADTQRTVWSSLAGTLTQVMALDPEGALIRSSTRTYRANASDQRRTNLAEGLSVLSHLENVPEAKTVLTENEMFQLQARLTLAENTLGGLVDDEHLPEAYYKQRARTEEARGHNWELLRQRAETNGLYFEPLGLGASRTHALLWIAREDLADTMHSFDPKFLGIANPYTDARLKIWEGLTTVAYFDAEGRWVQNPASGGSEKELIPLALYSLEYPKVPLLLVDFRDTRSPKRREMMRRAVNDAVIGVFGISRWGNWPYMAGSVAYNFVRSRQGDPNNRSARLKAFAQTRKWLALDPVIDPALQRELLRRIEILGVNPMLGDVFQERDLALRQYAALLQYSEDSGGLQQRLAKDRNSERTAYERRWKARAGFKLGNVLSLGLYRHKEPGEDKLLTALDRHRRATAQKRALAGELAQQGSSSSNASGN